MASVFFLHIFTRYFLNLQRSTCISYVCESFPTFLHKGSKQTISFVSILRC